MSLLTLNFNPRFPYGERRTQALACYIILVFQSTLPLRGATWVDNVPRRHPGISIHASLTGSDQYKLIIIDGFDISIHASLTGSDFIFPSSVCYGLDFNPRFPYGERLIAIVTT